MGWVGVRMLVLRIAHLSLELPLLRAEGLAAHFGVVVVLAEGPRRSCRRAPEQAVCCGPKEAEALAGPKVTRGAGRSRSPVTVAAQSPCMQVEAGCCVAYAKGRLRAVCVDP